MPRYVLFDEADGSVGEWSRVSSCSLAFGPNGPDAATVLHPKYIEGSLNTAVHHTKLLPNQRAALVLIDASDKGIPERWLGVAERAPDSDQAQTISVDLAGPHAWLGREGVPAQVLMRASAGRAMVNVIESHPGILRLDVGDIHEGQTLDIELSGGSFWDLASGLQDATGERMYLTAHRSRPRLDFHWLSPLDHDEVKVELIEGVNCRWSSDNILNPGPSELLSVGASFNAGVGAKTFGKLAPRGPVLGRRAALTAELQSAIAQKMLGQPNAVRPDLASASLLESAIDTALRRELNPPKLASVRVTDTDLWDDIRVGSLVLTRFTSDSLGLFRKAIAEVQSLAYQIEPTVTLDLELELWAVDE